MKTEVIDGDKAASKALLRVLLSRSVLFAILTMLLLAGVVYSTQETALAQSRERLLGTFTTGSGAGQDDRADDGRAAADLLAEGISALDRGDVMLGRRYLEDVIARFPDSLAARSAQRDLKHFFADRSSAQRVDRPTPSPLLGTRDRTSTPQEQRQSPADESRRAPAGNGQRERVQRALALDFLLAAGDRVFFGEANANLGARARTVLAAQSVWLKRHGDLPIVIEAHSDDRGSRDFNISLSQRRGEIVRDRLIEEGIAAERIVIRAHGNDQPIATCKSPECAAQNRRVVTSIAPSTSDSLPTRNAPDGYAGEHTPLGGREAGR